MREQRVSSVLLVEDGRLMGLVTDRDLRNRALAAGLEPCRGAPGVVDVRTLGAIGVVEFEEPVDAGGLCARFADLGCWIRPMGKVVYLTPPFVTSDAEMARLTGAIRAVVC